MGDQARNEMRLITLDRSLLKKEKDLLLNEMKTRSFFGDRKGILIEGITDKEGSTILEILEQLEDEDPFLIMTSGFLSQNSKLRRSVESNILSCSIGFYEKEMPLAEIQGLFQKWKVTVSDNQIYNILGDYARNYDFLEFRQELRKIALFKSFDETPLTLKEVEDIFSSESNPNEKKLVNLLIKRNIGSLIDYFKDHPANIKNPIGVITRAANHFKILHKVRCNEHDTMGILKKVWPPIVGKHKDQLIENSKTWSISNLEKALHILTEIELTIKENSKISSKALLIHGFLKVCLLK